MKKLSVTAAEQAKKISEGVIAALQATSVQFAASYKGEVIASGSVGKYDVGETRPLSNQDMYCVGSVSKVYVTAAAMLLVDKGQLDIDKPYKQYVPEFEMADPRYTKITPRHLMNHSSGIFGTHGLGAFRFEDGGTYTHDALLGYLKTDRLKYDPGKFSEYCNDGFQLLEILVERISGMPYNEYLSKNIFRPMGIKNTKTPVDTFELSQMAKHSMPQLYEGDLPYEMTNVLGSGGVLSTAEDMCLFGQVLMGKKLLSEKSAKLMAVREYETNDFWPIDKEENNLFAYGLGHDHVHVPPFDKVGIQALCKGGDTMEYHASLIVIPELDLAAGVLSAGGASFGNYLVAIDLLKSACLELGFVKEFPAEKTFEAPVKADMPAEMQRFAGLYAENGKFATIEIKDGEIEMGPMLSNMIPAQTYSYAADGRFVSPDGKNAIHFVETKNGPTFLQGDLLIDLPGVGVVQWKAFMYQKLEKNPISPEVAAVWAARKDKKYIQVEAFPTSMELLNLSEPTAVTMTVDTEYGYALGGSKILDKNTAQTQLYFREAIDLRFFTELEAEMMEANGVRFINMDCIPQFKPGDVTIPGCGDVQFFKVGSDLAGKTLTVTLPKNATFAAHAQVDPEQPKSPLKVLTTVTGNKPVVLEEGDTLVFVGSVGDVFTIALN